MCPSNQWSVDAFWNGVCDAATYRMTNSFRYDGRTDEGAVCEAIHGILTDWLATVVPAGSA